MKITVKMLLDRETKGAVRYQEVGPDRTPRLNDEQGAVMGTLYLRKKAIKEIKPEIEVTIELK